MCLDVCHAWSSTGRCPGLLAGPVSPAVDQTDQCCFTVIRALSRVLGDRMGIPGCLTLSPSYTKSSYCVLLPSSTLACATPRTLYERGGGREITASTSARETLAALRCPRTCVSLGPRRIRVGTVLGLEKALLARRRPRPQRPPLY